MGNGPDTDDQVEAVKHFFKSLTPRLVMARSSKIERDRKSARRFNVAIKRFFRSLTPRLVMARSLESELDRELARRFNVLDYLQTNELGLSRIIADLLDPRGKHGQGAAFLRAFLEKLERNETLAKGNDDKAAFLKAALELLGSDIISDQGSQVDVAVERQTHNQRRLDVSVEIRAANGQERYCLALENKPYAGDQQDQVKDYLCFLDSQYKERFLLVYLSPAGAGPSEHSVKIDELGKWSGRFAIMSYCERETNVEQDGNDVFDRYRIAPSLADWFSECRRRCDVDRLRWFLRDAEKFCHQTFGAAMTTETEKSETKKFILENPDNLETAWAVVNAWPDVMHEICTGVLEKLRSKIKERLAERKDSQAIVIVVTPATGWRGILAYKNTWRKRPEVKGIGRYSIGLYPGKQATNSNWYITISSPISNPNPALENS